MDTESVGDLTRKVIQSYPDMVQVTLCYAKLIELVGEAKAAKHLNRVMAWITPPSRRKKIADHLGIDLRDPDPYRPDPK